MRCSVTGCINDTRKTECDGVTFHKFPKDVNIRSLWLKSLDIVDWEPDNCSVVCSQHFQSDDFYKTKCGILKVKTEAVPATDIDIVTMLHAKPIKIESNEEDFKVNVQDIEIKQELCYDDVSENSKPKGYMTPPKFHEATTDHLFLRKQIKNELPTDETGESSKSISSKASVKWFDVPIITDSLRYVTVKSDLTKSHTTTGSTSQINTFISEIETGALFFNKPNTNKNVKENDIPLVQTPTLKKTTSTLTNRRNKQSTTINNKSTQSYYKTVTHAYTRSDRNNKFICNHCQCIFYNKNSLLKHIKSHSGITKNNDINQLASAVKDKANFCQNSTLICSNSERSISCSLGDKKFIDGDFLSSRQRVHTREKPFACDVCSRSFIHKVSLIRHKRLHTGEKLFECDVCDRKFTHKSSLIGHKRLHTGEKPFACDVCDRKFTQKNSLVVHKRLHTGEKLFTCDVCDRKFTHKITLTCHKRLHTGEKPFACDVCDWKFTQKNSMIVHKRLHTGEKPFACDECDRRFTRKSLLKIHARTHR